MRDGAGRCGTAPGIGGDDAFGTACGTGDGIAAAVRCALSRPARLGATRLVAVDGPSGSGKTSIAGPLAGALAEAVGGDVIQPERRVMDAGRRDIDARDAARTPAAQYESHGTSSYSTPEARYSSGRRPRVTVVSTDLLATWEHPLDWWPTLEERLLAPLAAGVTAQLPVVEWVSGRPRPGGVITVPPVDVLVLEGVSSGRIAVADRLSALVWIEIADRAARLERAVARDGEEMRRYLAAWQRDEDAHFAADATRQRADVVIAPDVD
jgi:uridine kinase